MLFRDTLRSAGFTLTTLMTVACVITVTKACSVPSMIEFEWFLEGSGEWTIPLLFDNETAADVVRELYAAKSINELQWRLGLTEDNMANIRTVIKNSLVGSKQPLMEMGMPERSWPEVEQHFSELAKDCRTGIYPQRINGVKVFIREQREWMLPNLFNGSDPLTVIYAMNVAHNISELQGILGLTAQNVENFRRAYQGAMEADERPLLAIGMPERSWQEVRYLLAMWYFDGFHET